MPDILVWHLGNRNPSITETITVNGSAFDLNLNSSTVRFRMRKVGSSTLKVDAAATIVQTSSGGSAVNKGVVRYDWLSADVDTAGDYLVWWVVTTSGKSQDVQEAIIQIVEHTPAYSALRDLCTIGKVFSYAPGYEGDPQTNDLVARLITSESQEIYERTGREFVALAANTTRQFDLTAWNARTRKVRIGDATTITTVTVEDTDGTTLETIASTDRVSLPRVRKEWEPITTLYFPPDTANSATYIHPGRVLEVTATWGYPSVPAGISEACASLVVYRYMSDAASAGTQFAEALADVNLPALFANAQETIRRHGRKPVA